MSQLSDAQKAMVDLFQRHVQAELDGDLDTTMATMTDSPHLNHVATTMGGVGPESVRRFYRDHLVGKCLPPDVKLTAVPRTVGDSRIVEEMVISFTHATEIDWMLPGVKPTGKPVEAAFVVVVGVKDGKVSHEHISWEVSEALDSPLIKSE